MHHLIFQQDKLSRIKFKLKILKTQSFSKLKSWIFKTSNHKLLLAQENSLQPKNLILMLKTSHSIVNMLFDILIVSQYINSISPKFNEEYYLPAYNVSNLDILDDNYNCLNLELRQLSKTDRKIYLHKHFLNL